MEHSFEVEIATRYGVNTAIFLNFFQFWIKKNEANKKHYHDGHYWTYNTQQAFKQMFPYMGKRQIETTLQKMVKEGLLIKGNYNKLPYDRTTWYALTDKAFSIFPKCEMENPEMRNGNSENVETIPFINTVINTDKHIYSQVVDYLNEKSGKHYHVTKDVTGLINARMSEGATLDDFKTVIDKKTDEWMNTEFEQYLRPKTLFSNKFDGYLNQPVKKPDKQSNEPQMDEQTQAEFEEWYKANVTVYED